jgi:Flp pilus assembly protein TadD
MAYSNRGSVWIQKGDYGKAFADFNKAIELDPNYAEAYNNRGVAWDHKGDYDKAIADFNKAIELDPNNAEAYKNRKRTLKGKLKKGT